MTKESYHYPKSIFFIIGNEFCERISFFGMQTILSIYLNERLGYSENDSIIIYHTWTTFVYFFPIIGGLIADSCIGRYRTIFYLSSIYAAGLAFISITSIPTLEIPERTFTIIGLLMVAIGTGGIKPCVSSFGGDQFWLYEDQKHLASFFSSFYFVINAGSLFSTIVIPILRADVKCFGHDCYPLAFGVPGILMIISICIFWLGKSFYIIKTPDGNVLVKVFQCIRYALAKKREIGKDVKKDHWMDYADNKYAKHEIDGIKCVFKLFKIFAPLPIFWSLYDQQGSRWIFQASRMNGDVGFYDIKPDQMQVINPVLILVFIPLFEIWIYPCLKFFGMKDKPLNRMVLGGFLASISFGLSGIVELFLEDPNLLLPSSGYCHLRIYSSYDCNIKIQMLNQTIILNSSVPLYENKNIRLNGTQFIKYHLDTSCDNFKLPLTGELKLIENQEVSYFLNDSVSIFKDSSLKSKEGIPTIRILRNTNSYENVTLVNAKSNKIINVSHGNISKIEVEDAKYNVFIGKKPVKPQLAIKAGTVNTIILNDITNLYTRTKDQLNMRKIEIVPPPTIHMLWLVPQYVVMTMGEVMFSVTGLSFGYTQAPTAMKSVVTAIYLLTMSVGNLVIVVLTGIKLSKNKFLEAFIYAGFMAADMCILFILSYNYKYVDGHEFSEVELSSIPQDDQNKIEKT